MSAQVFLASQKDVSAREFNREKTLRLIQADSKEYDEEGEEGEEKVAVVTKVRVIQPPQRALKVSMRVSDDELDFVDRTTS
jgi:hypothetical protein